MISFDVSEVATGFAGLVTVEISTELLEDVLMSHIYKEKQKAAHSQ